VGAVALVALMMMATVVSGAGESESKPKSGPKPIRPVVYPIPDARETPTILSPFFKPNPVLGSHFPPIPDQPCVCAKPDANADVRACTHWEKAPLYECIRSVPYGRCFKFGPYLPKQKCPCIHADNKRNCYHFGPPGSRVPIDQFSIPSLVEPEPVYISGQASKFITPELYIPQPSVHSDTPDIVKTSDYDRDIMARTVWAAGQFDHIRGQHAIAWVIVNRARDPKRRFPRTLAAVCQQPGQFQAWSSSNPSEAINANDLAFRRARAIVDGVLCGLIPDPTSGAQFYFAQDAELVPYRPSWAQGMQCLARTRMHIFCRAP